MIAFHKPRLTGREAGYVSEVLSSHHWEGDGDFTKMCCDEILRLTGSRALLMPSATTALETSLAVLNLQPGDEVILPSFGFVSTANAVVLNGLTPVFADVDPVTLGLCPKSILKNLSSRTRVLIPIHYAGVSCDLAALTDLSRLHHLTIIEDAAQAVGSRFVGKSLGTIGSLGVYSFHGTKVISCGEGGALLVNDENLWERAQVYRQKGTNRHRFILGEVDKYTWIDRGTSAVMSEFAAAILFAQLENLSLIVATRRQIYQRYVDGLRELSPEYFRLPVIPDECESNFHIFYILLHDENTRNRLLNHLRKRGVQATFHFLPLHQSDAGKKYGLARGGLDVSESVARRILRLPLYPDLQASEQFQVIQAVQDFFSIMFNHD